MADLMTTLGRLLFALPILLSLPSPSTAQNTATAARGSVAITAQLRLAETARHRGDEQRAVLLARQVLDDHPDHAAARTFLGFRFYEGRWRLPQEIAYLARASGRSASPVANAAVRPAGRRPAPARSTRPRSRQPINGTTFGTVNLRLQNVQLLGFDRVNVGYGTLMLPRTRSVSYGGTVSLPFGSCR